MCLAVSAFVFLNAFGKVLSGHGLDTAQIVWSRYLGGFLMAFMFMPRQGLECLERGNPNYRLQGRYSGRFVAVLQGLSHIALPTAAAISFTSPIFITALAMPLLAERVGPRRWAAVVVGFVGAMVVIRPGMEGTHWAVSYIVASTTCSVLYQILTRRVAGQDDAATSAMYPVVLGTLVVSAFAFFEWSMPQTTLDWVIFASLGIFGGGGHYCLTKAYEYGPAAVISPFNYLQLVGATIMGYLLFSDFPDAMTLAGASIIVVSGLYIAHREGLRRRSAR